MEQEKTSRKLSIILPVKNALEYTKECIESIFEHTTDFELIIVDDGSDKETQEYLSTILVQNLHHLNQIKLITHETSKGWCSAINAGLEIAKGNYLVLSNSDVVYTKNWAEKMIAHFEFDSKLGIVGPLCKEKSKDIDFSLEYTDYLKFFCVMIRRELYEKIGGLDTRFDPGGQDDADYCIRAKKAGWKIGIAYDVIIKHYGAASFREEFNNNVKKSHEYAASRQKILKDKWCSTSSFPTIKPNKKRPRVFIGLPNDNFIAIDLALLLMRWLISGKYDLYIYPRAGLFPLDSARNTILKEFRELDYDYLLWIDRDIIPPDNALDKLLAADKDIIGAVGFSMKEDNGQYYPYPVTLRYNEDREYQIYHGSGIDWVDATGGACILFKRHVYERIERPYEFTYHRDGTLNLTCDFHVFQKLQAMGFTVYIDFSILCEHLKLCKIKKIQELCATIKEQIPNECVIP